jgi:hypothetical protein
LGCQIKSYQIRFLNAELLPSPPTPLPRERGAAAIATDCPIHKPM